MEDVPQYIYRLTPTGFPSIDDELIWIFEVEFGNPYYGDFNMAKRFLQYILENSFCTRCMDRIRHVPHLKTCEYSPKTKAEWSSSCNRMCYIPSDKQEEFRKLWNRERARFRSFVRKSKLSKIPLPTEEILLELKKQQGNRCYYCFNEFVSNSSSLQPHRDHYVSVTNGGSNSIFNLVYACARCNQEKFTENGDQFISKWLPERLFPSDIRREVKKMRRQVAEWKQQFAPKNLAHVEKLAHEYDQRFPGNGSTGYDEWCDERLKIGLRLEQIRGEIRKG